MIEPERPALGAVLAVVNEARTVRENMEALGAAGLLPDGWATDTRRAWVCWACDHGVPWDDWDRDDPDGPDERYARWRRCTVCDRTGACAQPPSVAVVVAWASLGVDGIARVEALARAAVVSLRAVGCPQTDRVRWAVGKPLREGGAYRTRAFPQHFAFSNEGPRDAERFGRVKAAHALRTLGLAITLVNPDGITLMTPACPETSRRRVQLAR